VKCVVVGDGEEQASLRQAVSERGLEARVTFLGAVGDDELLTQLGRCRAVCFPAQAEDYGLVTVEAFASGKAVVTCTDSGGPAELVRDGENGFVTSPDGSSLAAKLAALSDDQDLAEQLGAAALADVSEMTWERAFGQLVVV
jgi:glycosyltransferase involved in cell wall biosynthesis